jgi:hypothetical protein
VEKNKRLPMQIQPHMGHFTGIASVLRMHDVPKSLNSWRSLCTSLEVITSTPFIISRLLCSWAKADLSYSVLTDAFESKEEEEVVPVALQMCKSFELERRRKVKRHCIALTDTQRATRMSHAKMNFWVSFSQ